MSGLGVLLADDHEVLRKGLRSLIETHAGWTVCGEASNGWQAVELATTLKPDVVVLDVTMPQLNGLEATRKIHRLVPESEILILTVHGSQHMLREALNAGARGYLLKSDAGRELLAAVEAVSQHRYFFSPKISRSIPELGTGDISEFQKADSFATPLTPREGEILQLLAEGKSNKDVATVLDISLKTVDTHRTSIMRKLQLHSMSELVRYAIRNKIVQA
jgi:DNA-binding NarL/FixJ family response regulator